MAIAQGESYDSQRADEEGFGVVEVRRRTDAQQHANCGRASGIGHRRQIAQRITGASAQRELHAGERCEYAEKVGMRRNAHADIARRVDAQSHRGLAASLARINQDLRVAHMRARRGVGRILEQALE